MHLTGIVCVVSQLLHTERHSTWCAAMTYMLQVDVHDNDLTSSCSQPPGALDQLQPLEGARAQTLPATGYLDLEALQSYRKDLAKQSCPKSPIEVPDILLPTAP